MTNSESPSPKKEENDHDYSFAADSDCDDEAYFDNVEVNAALKNLTASSSKMESSLVEEENIGKKLMDRKRLRIFTTITKKKTQDMEKSNGITVNPFSTGSFL